MAAYLERKMISSQLVGTGSVENVGQWNYKDSEDTQPAHTGVLGTRDLIFRLYIISISGEAEKLSIARGEINYLAAAYLICVPPPPTSHTIQGYLCSCSTPPYTGISSGPNIVASYYFVLINY